MARSATIGSFTLAAILIFAIAGISLTGGYAVPSRAMAAAPQELSTLYAVADSTIDNDAKDQNFGSRSTLGVAWSGTTTRLEQRAVVRFDLSRFGASCQIVDSATLHLERLAAGDGTTANITAWRATETWAEGTVNWYLQPGSTQPASLSTVDDQAGDTTWDVTEILQGWLDRTYSNFGFIMIGTHGGAYTRTFQSRETGSKPRLEVTYHSCFSTSTPTPTATVVTTTPTATVTNTPNVSPTPTPTRGEGAQYDAGDAPDSTNHAGDAAMQAYESGVQGHFPTVFRGSQPVGPLHWSPRGGAWLGEFVSLEYDADLEPDEDSTLNLAPATGLANDDGEDDGLIQPAAIWDRCAETTIRYRVTVPPGGENRTYSVNAWFDWNRDGAWGGSSECGGTATTEWAVQNQTIGPFGAPGIYEITSPAFVPWHPEGESAGPIWARLSLAGDTASSDDGSGPAAGYEIGETEDYYLTPPAAIAPTPTIDPAAAWNLDVTLSGDGQPAVNDTAGYDVTIENLGSLPLASVALRADYDPSCYDYLSAGLRPNAVDGDAGTVTWDNLAGPPPNGFWSPLLSGQDYTFRVELAALATCENSCVSFSGEAVDIDANDAGANQRVLCGDIAADTGLLRGDLGDAPDSSTGAAGVQMNAYTDGTVANFPSEHDGDAPYGPVHRNPRGAAWLGDWVSAEFDATIPPDEDTLANLDPAAGVADRDWADDGLIQPVDIGDSCQPATISYYVTVPPGQEGEAFAVNAWFDWDRNGDWGQEIACPGDQTASEWAVQNQIVGPYSLPGKYLVTSPEFVVYHPAASQAGGLWARLSLTTGSVDAMDGGGPSAGYRGGETEDYFLPHASGATPAPTYHLPLVMR